MKPPEMQSFVNGKNSNGFTLIELIVVVMIITILSAIGLSNFLEAQNRAKVSRVRADMRSIATGIESYSIDVNSYPPGYNTAPRSGLIVLTSPVAYITSADVLDPFAKKGVIISKSLLTYELVNSEGKIIEKGGGVYSVDPTIGQEPKKGVWWWLASRGPDKQFGFKADETEFDLREHFYFSNQDIEKFLATCYDPTNGTYSIGNIYRSGGAISNKAGVFMLN